MDKKLFTILTAWNDAIATSFKALKALIGVKDNLQTSNKNSLVEAINEVNLIAQSAATSGGAVINDTAPSTSTVFSSQKVEDRLLAEIEAVKATILGTGEFEEAYKTLQAVSQYIKSDKTLGAQMASDITNRIRYDAQQTLTDAQVAQVWLNIGLGEYVDLAALWTAQIQN